MTVWVQQSEAHVGAHIAKMVDQGGGVLRYDIIQAADAVDLVPLADAGDAEAESMLRRIRQTIDAINTAPSGKPVVCATCNRGLKGSAFALVWVHAEINVPSPSLFVGICERCGPDLPALEERACEVLQEIWPGARPITVHEHGGCA